MAATDGTTDAARIEDLLRRWAEATRTGRRDEVLTHHAKDVVIYDVLPPLRYAGADAYRRSWDEWQPDTESPGVFELVDLEVTAGTDVAYAHGLVHCGGTMPDGQTFEDWVRATFCLRKTDGDWVVTHQHISMPARGDQDGA